MQIFIINIIKIVTFNVDPKVPDIILNSMIIVINMLITNPAKKCHMRLEQTSIKHVHLYID